MIVDSVEFMEHLKSSSDLDKDDLEETFHYCLEDKLEDMLRYFGKGHSFYCFLDDESEKLRVSAFENEDLLENFSDVIFTPFFPLIKHISN